MNAIETTTYGELPAIKITASDGASATVTLYGAHLVSWRSADGQEQLFCSAKSSLDGSRAIRGGVPLIFPQFADRGDGVRHGFARTTSWRHSAGGARNAGAYATFELSAADLDPAVAGAWPHGFALKFTVELGGADLALTLDVKNTGVTRFAFSSALHSYLAVERLDRIRIEGVGAAPLQFDDAHESVHMGAGGPFVLAQPAGRLELTQSGFQDVVLWNPGAKAAAALSDLGDAEYQRFVCIEPAELLPVTLEPGELWRGQHQLRYQRLAP